MANTVLVLGLRGHLSMIWVEIEGPLDDVLPTASSCTYRHVSCTIHKWLACVVTWQDERFNQVCKTPQGDIRVPATHGSQTRQVAQLTWGGS